MYLLRKTLPPKETRVGEECPTRASAEKFLTSPKQLETVVSLLRSAESAGMMGEVRVRRVEYRQRETTSLFRFIRELRT